MTNEFRVCQQGDIGRGIVTIGVPIICYTKREQRQLSGFTIHSYMASVPSPVSDVGNLTSRCEGIRQAKSRTEVHVPCTSNPVILGIIIEYIPQEER